MNSWCTIPPDAPPGENCDWQSNSSHSVLMNRATLGWSASAASFAYAFGRLSELDFFIVGQDQLIGGPWPNNEPAVASLDWDTGLPNAKYYAINMLATAFGTVPRDLFNTTVSSTEAILETEAVMPGRAPPSTGVPLYALAVEVPGSGGGPARRLLLLVSKTADALAVNFGGGFPEGAMAIVLEGAGLEPGFNPPQPRAPDASGALQLGSYAVAIVTLA